MSGPCTGLEVVEVALDVSEVGLGLACGVPGMILADLGATVTRLVGPDRPTIDAGVEWGRVWHRDKRIVTTADPAPHLASADVAIVYGPEHLVEGRGLGWRSVGRPGLVYARCRPSRWSGGQVGDYGLLVEARSGFCNQLEGPAFVDVRASGSGAAFLLTASVLALLRRRALTGEGGWAETSLYDGMLATLGCMIGRSERAAPEIERYWEQGSWFPNFLYRCADGELVQVWFGGKGMYDRLIEVLGDEPSVDGYYADQAHGRLNDRAVRWRETFVTRPRDEWIAELRAAGVACEPVLAPGQALSDPHLAEIGLAATRTEHGTRDILVATPLTITPSGGRQPPPPAPVPGGALLEGVRVVDFSAFVAGPLAGEILADLGATVVKVEPPHGEAMRGAAYAVAACQRGKRSVAIDINAPGARPVVDRLLRWADVVLHNFRVGVAERIGIDEATVARVNPGAVYCHASAFGTHGPRARYPGNDALMQALTGFERAVGGAGNDPVAATWIPIDMSGGWVAAAGILAGLYARAVTGRGQHVTTSLLGAGMLLQSGVFQRDGRLVEGPQLDGGRTGYGAGYRIYRAGDGRWLALVVPDPDAWGRLRRVPGLEDLPAEYAPMRSDDDGGAEKVLEAAIASGDRDGWVRVLRAAGQLVEQVATPDRDEFRRGILDDPVNRALGRVAAYPVREWGRFEQIGGLVRTGPVPAAGRPGFLPGIGEHSEEVLAELGVGGDTIEGLLASGVMTRIGTITPPRRG